MNEQLLDTLTQRLDRLERANRSWKGLAILLLLATGTVVLMGQVPRKPAVLEAEKFILRDRNGHMRAQLTMSAMEWGPALFSITKVTSSLKIHATRLNWK